MDKIHKHSLQITIFSFLGLSLIFVVFSLIGFSINRTVGQLVLILFAILLYLYIIYLIVYYANVIINKINKENKE